MTGAPKVLRYLAFGLVVVFAAVGGRRRPNLRHVSMLHVECGSFEGGHDNTTLAVKLGIRPRSDLARSIDDFAATVGGAEREPERDECGGT